MLDPARQCAARRAEVGLWMPRELAEPHLGTLDPAVDFRPFEHPRLRQAVRQLRSVRSIVREIKAFDPDVIHFQHGHMWFNLALPALRHYPLVITIHDPRSHLGDQASKKTSQRVMDFGYHRADRVIVHARAMREAVVDALNIPAGRIDVVPHVAIGESVAAGDSVNEDGNLVLFFGRIWEYKGLDYLIRAEPLISAEVPDARIMIGGRGDDFARYRGMMAHPEKFDVHNEWISYEQRVEMFQRSAVVVLPYVEATQSGVVPVAYTYSKPVVCTATGGLPEMVDDGVTGFVVPPRDERALADAVIKLLKDEPMRHAMGRAGREKLDTEWCPDVVAEQTLEVYRQTIADRQESFPAVESRDHSPCAS
ncbi:MAG: glycosyltransferase family 4 protein [Pirellulales bacterium]